MMLTSDANKILTQSDRVSLAWASRYKLTSVLVGLIAALLLGESLLQIALPSQSRYYVWQPNLQFTLHPNSEVLPGITGEARFITNSAGIRGNEFAEGQTYRILAVGGSTTECLYLDENETWPSLLEKRLIEERRTPIWVGNIGRSGRNTRDHILQLKYLLPQYPKIDAVILLAGINDLHIRISDLKYDPLSPLRPTFEDEYKARAFAIVPSDQPLYHYTRLGWWRAAKRFKNIYFDKASDAPVMDFTGAHFADWRRYRRNAEKIVEDLPDLTTALGEYRRNLEIIADTAQRRSIRLLFVTQPTIWRSDLSKEETELLWMGGIGSFQLGKGHLYYSASSLEKAVRQYNATLLDVCRERAIECVDLAGALPKDTTVFYDEVHFNESGARQVAEVLLKHIGSRLL